MFLTLKAPQRKQHRMTLVDSSVVLIRTNVSNKESTLIRFKKISKTCALILSIFSLLQKDTSTRVIYAFRNHRGYVQVSLPIKTTFQKSFPRRKRYLPDERTPNKIRRGLSTNFHNRLFALKKFSMAIFFQISFVIVSVAKLHGCYIPFTRHMVAKCLKFL